MAKSPVIRMPVVVLLCLTTVPPIMGQDVGSPASSDFKVTLLGTSTPNPLPDRFGPSTLVEAGSEKLVFDCGRGATIRLWQLKIPLGAVKLFITHLHSDHTVGIPDLWLTGWLQLPYGGRKEAFRIWGPKGTEEMMSHLEKAYREDIRIRREFNPALSDQQVAIAAKDLTEGVVYDQGGVRVTAFRVKHAEIKDAFGFRVDYKGRSVALSGDMASNENFVKYAAGADVVIHEVGVASSKLLEAVPEARRMLATHHSSPEDAGKDFARIKPKLAVYSHYTRLRRDGFPEVTIPEIIARTRATYSGPLEAGEDLMSISIGGAVTVQRYAQ